MSTPAPSRLRPESRRREARSPFPPSPFPPNPFPPRPLLLYPPPNPLPPVGRRRGRKPVPPRFIASTAGLGDQHLLQCLEVLDTLAGPERHGMQRVVRDQDRHAG